MIKRFNPPTHLDPMPYLSEWHHELEDGSVQIWVQCNEVVDENTKPRWRRFGDIVEEYAVKENKSINDWIKGNL